MRDIRLAVTLSRICGANRNYCVNASKNSEANPLFSSINSSVLDATVRTKRSGFSGCWAPIARRISAQR